MQTLPALFISHGSPTILLEKTPSHDALRRLAADLDANYGVRPRAIVVASAHWETQDLAITGGAAPETIHDFYGFQQALYDVRYPAPGNPDLAAEILSLMAQGGVKASIEKAAGFDHGTWIPLALAYPDAAIPVVQLSIQPHKDPKHHLKVGKALRSLREQGILVIGSGALTHNLREIQWRNKGSDGPAWVEDFGNWVLDHLSKASFDTMAETWTQAPAALRNHPTTDHLWPLFVAAGAATPGVPGRVIHQGTELGVLRMDIYAFD